jgi:hypothetical protein
MPPTPFADTPLKTRLLAACLLQEGRSREGEQLISSQLPSEAGGDFLKFYQAMAWAQENRVDEPVRALLELLDADPQNRVTRDAVMLLLKRQGVEKINAREWNGAAAVIDRMLGIDPAYPGIADLQGPLESILPTMALKAGRRAEAAKAWEGQLQLNPKHGIASHSLALLYYFQAEHYHQSEAFGASGGKGNYPVLRELWRQAMANWALTRYQDGFWDEWAARRRQVYKINPAAIAKLRQDWGDELSKKFRQLKNDLEDTGSDAGRELYEDLEAEYWLEMALASTLHELKKFTCPHCSKPTLPTINPDGEVVCEHQNCGKSLEGHSLSHHLLCCGPLMLGHLGLQNVVQELAESAASLANGGHLSPYLKALNLPFLKNNAEALAYLSAPWGLGLAYLVQRIFIKAIAQLQGVTGDRKAELLLLHAYLDYGQQSESFIPPLPTEPDEDAVRRYLVPIREALEIWREGWQYRQADRKLAAKLEERIEGLSVRAGNEMKQASGHLAGKKLWDKEIRYLSAGIEVLELARKITPRDRIKDTMAVLYVERGMSHLQNDSVNKSISDIEAALKLRPGDAHIQEKAAIAYNLRACQRSGQASMKDFNRAIELDDTRGLYYRNRAMAHVSARQVTEALKDLKRACELDPGNEQFRKELIQLFNSIR